ncbi:GNAT family N-acetyltransferase [Thermodesulfobacteriota bacterium]
MLTYTYLIKPTSDQVDAITAMYRSEGWWTQETDDPELVAQIIVGSHCFLLVMQDGDSVGMGRAISDGASDAYIQDVTVKKEHRGQGIGTHIIRKLVERLNADGLDWIGLIAENNSYQFYESLGFSKMPNSVPMLNLKK